MWVVWMAAAVAADDTIDARADAIEACEPAVDGCVKIVSTAIAMTVGPKTTDAESRVLDVKIDVSDLKRLKRTDELVLRLAIPRSLLPAEPESPPVEVPTNALSAPWSTMNLPIGEGTILRSDGWSMAVVYAEYCAPRRASEFDAAIMAAGWESTFQSDDGGMFSHTYSHHTETLTFSAMELAGRTTLSISRF